MNRQLSLLLLLILAAPIARAQQNRDTNRTPVEVVSSAFRKVIDMIDPPEDAPPKTFYVTTEVRKAEGLPKWVADISAKLALQLPDRMWFSVDAGDKSYSACRDKQKLWVHSAAKRFAVVGEPGHPRFSAVPASKDETHLGPLKLPLAREKMLLLPFLMDIKDNNWVDYEDLRVHVFELTPKKEAADLLKIPAIKLKLWLDTNDLPIKVAVLRENPKMDLQMLINNLRVEDPWSDERWQVPKGDEEKSETTAVSHLVRFMDVWTANFGKKIPAVKGTGKRVEVAREGEGRLELIDGTRVLFLKGSPEEMGHQQGVLLKKEIQDVKERILYGVGVGSSFVKGKWFFGEIESAEKRLVKFMDRNYLAEMDAMASAANIDRQEIRLANYFPELFHCSGFALYGKATATGKMYHGRILDYLKGVGLEQNAVVMVMEPEGRNAWVNIGYAGFIGSVTAMNEKHVAIGEMGGRGEGDWDGKPMAELVREVMEKANTIDEALAIMRKSPRTCEYYYVISDGKTRRAVGVRATPKKFETVEPGQKHDKLPEPIEDAVVLSADKRYEELVKRIKEHYGKINSAAAIKLMEKPVAMDSNIHSVLFVPETLDFYVANADSDNAASHTQFRQYNLGKLLNRPAEAQTAAK